MERRKTIETVVVFLIVPEWLEIDDVVLYLY